MVWIAATHWPLIIVIGLLIGPGIAVFRLAARTGASRAVAPGRVHGRPPEAAQGPSHCAGRTRRSVLGLVGHGLAARRRRLIGARRQYHAPKPITKIPTTAATTAVPMVIGPISISLLPSCSSPVPKVVMIAAITTISRRWNQEWQHVVLERVRRLRASAGSGGVCGRPANEPTIPPTAPPARMPPTAEGNRPPAEVDVGQGRRQNDRHA